MNTEVFAAVMARAAGKCEACGVSMDAFGCVRDHFFGRAKAPEEAATVWALCVDCDHQKTNGIPSAVYWLGAFLKHQKRHGYDSTRTADKLHFAKQKAAFGKGAA